MPKQDGVIIADTDDGRSETPTYQCCHCGRHFTMRKGSGRIRGFCTKCLRVTCGDKECDPCVPFQKKLDLYEAGKIRRL